jgi:short-subunit dehydrogenase
MSDCCWTTSLLFYIGLAVVLKLLYKLGCFVNRNYVRKGHDAQERYGKDSWVFVTGATGGIGLETCKYAAKEKGLNVILAGRNPEKLKQCQKEVEAANPKIKTKTVKLDFDESNDISYYQKVVDEVKDLDVSILVNNAGVMYMGAFENITCEQIKQM